MYRRTDLAEIVSNPSPITLKYLGIWFCGSGSFGKAMTMLGWPVVMNDEPLLVWDQKNGLRVDMTVEEKILYAHTIFRYQYINNRSILKINTKQLSLPHIVNTIRAIWSQSKLLVNYQNTYDLAKSYAENIPLPVTQETVDVEDVLKNMVWPHVIAVDYIGEFVLSILTNNLSPEKKLNILTRIQTNARDIDWYTQAMLSWNNYKEGKLSAFDLLNRYGYAAGDDYELTKPRYYEMLKQPKPAIVNYGIENMKITNLEGLAVGMHYLRSEVKRRSLIWIAALRENLLKNKVI